MPAKSLIELLGRIFRRRGPRPQVPVTLYTREGCHLCEDLERMVMAQPLEVELVLCRVDVDGDPQLAERYGHQVPVLTVGGRRAFAGALRPDTIRPRLLELTRRYLDRGPLEEPTVGPAPGSGAQ